MASGADHCGEPGRVGQGLDDNYRHRLPYCRHRGPAAASISAPGRISMAIINVEARNERARNLGGLNGLRMALVSLAPAVNPTQALLEVHFFNTNEVANILAQAATPAHARTKFPISGGHRVPAGPATGQVQVLAVAAGPD